MSWVRSLKSIEFMVYVMHEGSRYFAESWNKSTWLKRLKWDGITKHIHQWWYYLEIAQECLPVAVVVTPRPAYRISLGHCNFLKRLSWLYSVFHILFWVILKNINAMITFPGILFGHECNSTLMESDFTGENFHSLQIFSFKLMVHLCN